MAPKIILVYFNIRGRGEILRLALIAAGVKFVDDRIEFAEWPKIKDDTPHGKLPYIEYKGRVYSEVLPIARFLAKKYGLMGKTEVEELEADIILHHVDVVKNACARFRTDSVMNKKQKDDLRTKFWWEVVPEFLTMLTDRLDGNVAGFLVGTNLTIADLAVFDEVENIINDQPNSGKPFPLVEEHYSRIASLPKIKAYLESRPQTDR